MLLLKLGKRMNKKVHFHHLTLPILPILPILLTKRKNMKIKKIINTLLLFSMFVYAEVKEHVPTKLEKSYLEAVYYTDFKGVQEAINKGVDINVSIPHRQPPLIFLLSSLNKDDNNYDKKVRLINYLIDKGIDINAMPNKSFSWTAIHYAILKSNYSIIDNLLKHHVKVDLKTLNVKEGEPPIFSVVSIEKPIAMLKYLLTKKVGKLTDVATNGNTILHAAVDGHINLKLVKYLADKISLESRNKKGETILLKALANTANYSKYSNASLEEIIAFLVKKGAKVKVASKSGNSALIMALKFRHSYNTIKLLLENGADVNFEHEKQYKPIIIATVRYDSKRLLALLVKHGAKLDETIQEDNSTLLHLSVSNRNKENVAYLLDNNVSLNAKNNDGKTALNLAIENSYSDIISMLKSKGAVASTKEEIAVFAKRKEEEKKAKALAKKQEVNTIYDAIKLAKNNLVKEYYENNSSLKTKLINLAMFSVKKGNKESLDYFLKQGLDVNSVDKNNYNLLQQSVYYDKPEMIKLFLKKGLKINEHKEGTRSNFDLSCRCSVKTFKYLHQIGMKAQKDEKKKIVTNAIYAGNIKLAKYLLSKKYPFNKKVLKNDNFLLKIIRRGDIEAFKILFANGLDAKRKVEPLYGKWSLLYTSLMYKQYDLSKFLFTKEVDLYEKVSGKENLVDVIVGSGDIELLDLYLKKGYDINYVDKKDVFANTLLEIAFEKEEPKIIKYLIKKGAKLELHKKKENVLLEATRLGYLDIVKILIEKKGADPYFIYSNINHKNMNLKEIALLENHQEVAKYLSQFDTKKLLLKKMEDGNISDVDYKYLFSEALEKNDIELLDKFKKDKDFNAIVLNDFLRKVGELKEPKEFSKALKLVNYYHIKYDKYAVLKNVSNLKVFSYLVNKWNSKGFLKSEKSYSLLLDLIYDNKIDFIKFLLKKNVSLKHYDEYYGLLPYAMENRKRDIVKLLLKQEGLNVSTIGRNNLTALELAIVSRDKELVTLLLKKKHGLSKEKIILLGMRTYDNNFFNYLCNAVKLTKKEIDDERLLIRAVNSTTIPIIENVLDRGARRDITDKNNYTVLSYAVNRGLPIVKLLVKKGVKLDKIKDKQLIHEITNKYAFKALSRKVVQQDIELIEFLSKNLKIDLDSEEHGYETALGNIIGEYYPQYDDLILSLIALKADISESDIALAFKKNVSKKVIKKLIEAYVPHYEENIKKRWDPLIPAVKYNDNNLTKLVIEKKFSVTKYSSCENTYPLLLAVDKNNTELVKVMLKHIGCNDKKAYDYLIKSAKKKGYVEIVKLLQKKALTKSKACVWNPYLGLTDKEIEALDEKNYHNFLNKTKKDLLHIGFKNPYPKNKKDYDKFVEKAYKVAQKYGFNGQKDIFIFTLAWHVSGKDFLKISKVKKILNSDMKIYLKSKALRDYSFEIMEAMEKK